jgi:NitT/TauT family transport system substrate-binding protein
MMRTWTRREIVTAAGRGVAGLATAGLLAACGRAAGVATGPAPTPATAAASRALKKVGVILGGPTIYEAFANASVAQYLGYFRDEGLELDMIPSAGSDQAVQEVAAGKVLVGWPSPDPVILGYQSSQNLKLKWLYTSYQGFIYDLRTVAGSPITSIKDLAGKTIGVVSLASAALWAAKAMLRENGVDPARVTFVAIGQGSQAASAIKAGRVDAVALWDAVYAQLANEGIRFNPPFQSPTLSRLFSNGFVVTPQTLTGERTMLVGLCRAIAKGTVWVLNNPEQAVRIHWHLYPATKPSGMPEDQALQRSLAVLKARLPYLTLDWVSVKKWGYNAPERWAAYEQFLYGLGILQQHVDVTQIYTNDLIDDVNRFDAAAIADQAKKFVFAG